MTVTTKNRAKLGTEEWHGGIWKWPEDDLEPTLLLENLLTTKSGIARWVRRQLDSLRGSGAYGEISGYRYDASEFDDHEYGRVLDADAVLIASAHCYESNAGTIDMDWDETDA